MLLKVPSNLDECSLGQLVCLSDFATIMSKKGERTEAEAEALGLCFSGLLNVPISVIEVLTKSTLDQITKSVNETFLAVCKDMVAFSKAKNMTPVFECKPEDWRIIQSEYYGANRVRRVFLDRKYKARTYEVVENPETLPAQIWIKMLDNILVRKSRIGENDFWKEWNLIPTALACTAWGKTENTHKKSDSGQVIVDMERIRKMEDVFLQVPAKVGISAYGFFLASINISWAVDHYLYSVKK